ncbi:MAG: hypothetical protein AB1758_21365, partial [Candidatus Eremiobacterota bacterium]
LGERGRCVADRAGALAAAAGLSARACDHSRQAGAMFEVGRLALRACGEEFAEENPCAAAAYLLNLWGFPAPVVAAVACCANPAGSPNQELGPLAMVHLASRLLDGAEVDMDYFDRLGVRGRVAEWIDRSGGGA